LIGLFLLVRGESQTWPCVGQAIIMIMAMTMTLGYQILLNYILGPLLSSLPTASQIDIDTMLEERTRDSGYVNTGRTDPSSSEGKEPELPIHLEYDYLLDRRSTILIPKDSLGFSDFEVSNLRGQGGNIKISNSGATIDARGRLRLASHSD